MPTKSGDRHQDMLSPLDQLIHLIAEIEVERYMQEIAASRVSERLEHEGSHLRSL